ncbi:MULTISPECIES: YceI family protein [Rufibacter]|uniref:Polyisoprenoid-binding protein YceI n=1 Tax=Rufibacter quisquiliarum TaxID=1549639 RepID=A0A839GHW2_9BACT|nr:MULTISPECIES: YceI family protein [Rufibacter]MBA9079244.1 polyisoprenoid-binding protein YceI [Rufibacter quisquiliarum]
MKALPFLKKTAVAITLAAAFAACDKAPKGDQATITDQQDAATAAGQSFMVDTADSKIRFTGNGVGKNHPGTFKLSSGTVAVANNQITGGQFTINIQSMDMEEEGEMIDTKLRPHLMSGDFFDAEKFGTAKFEITKVEPYQPTSGDTSLVEGANFNVSGNLTLKGETKNITFPARIELNENSMEAEANFDIDRRQWKMNYGNDKTLGDKFISETVNIELDLKATKPNGTGAAQ